MFGPVVGPGLDIISVLLPAILLGGVIYLAVSLAQRGAPSRGDTGPVGVENAMLRTLYTLAVAALVAAFVGFGIEVFYPTPGFPEGPFADRPGGPPPEVEDTVPAELPPDAEEEPPPKGPPPDFEPGLPPEISAYERELAEHNRVASPVAIGAAVLILVAGLIPRLGRLPVIGSGVTLGGVLTLFYGVILALQTQSPLLRFLAVAVGLLVLLIALYVKFRPGRTASS